MANKTKKYKKGGSVEIQPLDKMRKIIIEMLAEGKKMHHIHVAMKFDVTNARNYISKIKESSGETLSFTGFLLYCLSQTLNDHKSLCAYRKRKKLYVFDEIDVSILIERTASSGKKVPVTKIIRKANFKDFSEINSEIRGGQVEKLVGTSLGNSAQSKKTNLMIKLPKFIRKILYWHMRTSPKFKKDNIGQVNITAVGMFADQSGVAYPIPIGPWSMIFVVGTLEKILKKENGELIEREMLNCVMTLNHDVVDGGPGARFIVQFKNMVEKASCIKDLL